MRQDLHRRLVTAKGSAETAEEHRLVEAVLGRFEKAGAHVTDADQRAKVAALDSECASLAFEMEQNINEDCSHVLFTEDELDGCPADFLAALPRQEVDPPCGGRARGPLLRCSVKAPVLTPIMQRAKRSETRRRILEAAQKQCEAQNGPLLLRLVQGRHQAAQHLGFASHAERMLGCKMAGSAAKARLFCEDMLRRVSPLRDADLQRLSERRRADVGGPGVEPEGPPQKCSKSACGGSATDRRDVLQAWDTAFYTDLLKREEMSLDDEKLKEFFPLEGTIDRLLDIYATMVGLNFRKTTALPVWHDDVVTFEVLQGDEVVGHLYLDQFPRDGKFGHQMIIPLAPSFVDGVNGTRCVPACANISNFPRPQGDKPALLRFNEMRTLFHELGHAMHCLCATTRYSVLSWAWPMVPWPGGVEQDFLELPSMALEKLASEPTLLRQVARHYSGKQGPDVPSITEETVMQIKAQSKFMFGPNQCKYFALALFDLILHSQEPPYTFGGASGLSIQELYAKCVEEHTKLAGLPGTHPSASWYHMVIGYDAGFYGYGWSDVYAADVFEAMVKANEGPLSAAVGSKLRREILEPCATRPGAEMLRAFLGREPTADAWCRYYGVPL